MCHGMTQDLSNYPSPFVRAGSSKSSQIEVFQFCGYCASHEMHCPHFRECISVLEYHLFLLRHMRSFPIPPLTLFGKTHKKHSRPNSQKSLHSAKCREKKRARISMLHDGSGLAIYFAWIDCGQSLKALLWICEVSACERRTGDIFGNKRFSHDLLKLYGRAI